MSLRSILFSAKSQSVQDCFSRVTEQAGPEKQLIFANTLRATLLTGLDKRDPGKPTYKDLVDELHHIELGMLDEFRTPVHAKYDDEYCWASIARVFFAGASSGFRSPHSSMLVFILDCLVARCQKRDVAELVNKIFLKVALNDQAHDSLRSFVSIHRLDVKRGEHEKGAQKKTISKKVRQIKSARAIERESFRSRIEQEASDRVKKKKDHNKPHKRNDKPSGNFGMHEALILASITIGIWICYLWLK